MDRARRKIVDTRVEFSLRQRALAQTQRNLIVGLCGSFAPMLFLDSFPPAPVTQNPEAITRFFAS